MSVVDPDGINLVDIEVSLHSSDEPSAIVTFLLPMSH
jgi:hypothetical protein